MIFSNYGLFNVFKNEIFGHDFWDVISSLSPTVVVWVALFKELSSTDSM